MMPDLLTNTAILIGAVVMSSSSVAIAVWFVFTVYWNSHCDLRSLQSAKKLVAERDSYRESWREVRGQLREARVRCRTTMTPCEWESVRDWHDAWLAYAADETDDEPPALSAQLVAFLVQDVKYFHEVDDILALGGEECDE